MLSNSIARHIVGEGVCLFRLLDGQGVRLGGMFGRHDCIAKQGRHVRSQRDVLTRRLPYLNYSVAE